MNHGLAVKLVRDLLHVRSLGRLFSFRYKSLKLYVSLMKICCFAALLKFFFSSLKLNFMHDGDKRQAIKEQLLFFAC